MKLSNKDIVSKTLLNKYDFYSYNHAIDILKQSYLVEWNEIIDCLMKFEISISNIKKSGGNKSEIPKKIDNYLFPLGWDEIRITGDLNVNFEKRSARKGKYKKGDNLSLKDILMDTILIF